MIHQGAITNKSFWILLPILFLFCLPTLAQPRSKYNITGAWTGYVKTTDKKIPYEVVINDSAGTYTGYSKIIFEVKGKELSAIKSLDVRIEDDKYILEEMQLLSDNYDQEAPRKIKQINTLDLQIGTRKMSFSGAFKTKATMGLKSATGEVFLQKAIDPDSSLLFNALKKMGVADSLSFVKAAKEEAQKQAAKKIQDSLNNIAAIEKRINDSLAKASEPVVATNTPKTVSTGMTTRAVSITPSVVRNQPQPPSKTTTPAAPAPATRTPAVTMPPPVVATPPPKPKPRPQAAVAPGSATDLTKRTIETIQTVYYKSDSLVLTLYDNGEVDGDTVSVVVNGKVFMGKKGLTTKPISETYYITPETGDSLQMIMYAENLGSIAPNTGLLIIQDGRDRYEIRFSGDLNKNAAIIFKRER